MASFSIPASLDTVETHLNQVAQLLLEPDSGDLLQASSALQAAVLDFSRLAQRAAADFSNEPSFNLRLRKVSAALASCRESLLRRAFITQSALGTLVPATRDNTYAPAAGKFARQPYGSAGRQSGEFRMTSA